MRQGGKQSNVPQVAIVGLIHPCILVNRSQAILLVGWVVSFRNRNYTLVIRVF